MVKKRLYTMKTTFLIFVFTVVLILPITQSYGAVTSVGEINVVDETKGIVPASSTVPLIITLIIDRSRAVPGEEIKTIEIIMPPGYVPQISDFEYILHDGEEEPATAAISGGNVLRIQLSELILDKNENFSYEIIFDCRTPNTFGETIFQVRLRNLQDDPIGEFIKPGEADGKQNNNDFTLMVIPNVPPDPVLGFMAEADKTGENDVTLRWQKSTDSDVSGYLIYRDTEFQIDVIEREATTYRDINVLPGDHTYEIAAYKIKTLQSERSPIQNVTVSEDTAAPKPPTAIRISTSGDGVEVLWKPSISRDVVKYRILFGSVDTEILKPLPERENLTLHPDDIAEGYTHRYIHSQVLSTGSFTYAVLAIDEAGNESEQIQKRYRIFDKPYPNPFTPLSPDPDFNTVIFSKRNIDDVEEEGEFSLMLYNLNGVLVRTITAEIGEIELKWDGKDESGEVVESGIYIYQLQVGDNYKTGTVIVAK